MQEIRPLPPFRVATPGVAPSPTARAAREAAPRTDGLDLQGLPPLQTPKKAVTVLAESFGYAEFPQASPDGKHVIFNVVGDYDTSQMIRMKADGSDKRALLTGERVRARDLPEFLEAHRGRIDEQGTWTADGRSVYYRTNSGGHFSIARFDLDDASARTVVQLPEMNLKHPVETAEGYILGYGGPPDATYKTSEQYSDIFVADPRTGQVEFLTHSDGTVSYKHPSAMKGAILAHVEPKQGEDPKADLVALDPAGGPERNLTSTPDSDERHPFYNPRVDLVAYHSDDSGDKNLWLATPDFDRRVQLTFYGKPAQSPSWSPDGQTLYFVKKDARQPEGEPFYKRQADIRALDVPKALKDLHAQARERCRELEKDGASESLQAAAREALEDYRFFLERALGTESES
jgi:Tol biopolymer transport system component